MEQIEGIVTVGGEQLRDALELERIAMTLPGVRGAKVDADLTGIRAVRVLVMPERDTESTIREIRTIAASSLGSELDPTKIHVLRTSDAAPTRQRRRRLSSVMVERSDTAVKARVTLELPGDVLIGEDEAPSGRLFEMRTVARAVLDGLDELLDFKVDIEGVETITRGSDRVIMVFLARGEDRLVGSAMVRVDEHDAVARATLDALNRFLGSSLLSSVPA